MFMLPSYKHLGDMPFVEAWVLRDVFRYKNILMQSQRCQRSCTACKYRCYSSSHVCLLRVYAEIQVSYLSNSTLERHAESYKAIDEARGRWRPVVSSL